MILGPDGRALGMERIRLEKQTRFNPTAGLTPDALTQRLTGWARGDLSSLAWTMDWVERHDDTCSVVADKARRAVSRYGWDVLPDDDIDPAMQGVAEEQARILRRFYRGITARHAVDLDERGRMGLLCRQMMDAYGQMYSMHHVVWKTGRELTAEIIKVPLWHFESRRGQMAWLDTPWAIEGKPLAEVGGDSAWIVAKNRGVMLAGVIAWMYKHIPLQDWLTYCDRHGMPGFIGKTASEYGSKGWDAMTAAVAAIGAEFGGVINTGDAIEVLDLTAQGNIPYPMMVDRMDRAITILWRGGDLGTISRGGDAVGSNAQSEDTDDLDADNSMWVGETLDMSLGRRVIDYYFGADAPMLASLRIGSRTRDDQTKQLAAVSTFVGMGGRVSKAWYAQKFGIQEAAEGETETLSAPQQQTPAAQQPVVTAANDIQSALASAMGVQADRLAPIAPALDRLAALAENGDAEDELRATAQQLLARLPDVFDPLGTADVAALLAGAMADGFTKQLSL